MTQCAMVASPAAPSFTELAESLLQDDPSVVALMAQASATPIRTFSIGFAEADFDELAFARQVATRYGTDHYEVAVVLHNLAALDRHRDRASAQRLYERALSIKQRRLGPNHPEVGVILNNLAAFHSEQGEHDRAADVYTNARRILRRGFGAHHPATRACEENRRRVDGRRHSH